MSNGLTVAVVGGFQRGKSTLVNVLLGQDMAEMGRGLSTTHETRTYTLTSAVSVIDTPGFNANGKDDDAAKNAVRQSDFLVYVHESDSLGETCSDFFEYIRGSGKQFLFLLNCCKFGKWGPEENGEIADTIDSELNAKGILPLLVPIENRKVFPINVLWARFGIGQNIDQDDDEKIRFYARRHLCLPVNDMGVDSMRAEILRRSGFLPVRDFLKNLPLELLKHSVFNPQQAIDRIVDRFAVELKKRWAVA